MDVGRHRCLGQATSGLLGRRRARGNAPSVVHDATRRRDRLAPVEAVARTRSSAWIDVRQAALGGGRVRRTLPTVLCVELFDARARHNCRQNLSNVQSARCTSGVDLSDRPVDPAGPAGGRAGGTWVRVAVGDRAHAHPDEPAHAVAGRSRAPRGVPAHARPVRRPHRRRRRSPSGCASAPASRSSPSTTRSRWPRRSPRSTSCRAGACSLGIGVGWNVDEMEHHGVDPGAAAGDRPRARPRHARPVDRGRGVLRRRPRAVLAVVELAEAGQRSAPADHHGRRRRAGHVPPRRRVLRRLDADPRPPQHRRQARRAAPRRRRGRPRPGDDRARRVRLPGRPGGRSTATPRWASPAA